MATISRASLAITRGFRPVTGARLYKHTRFLPTPPSPAFSVKPIIRLQSTLTQAPASSTDYVARKPEPFMHQPGQARPLAAVPLIVLLRSILLHTVSGSPFLLKATTALLGGTMKTLDSPFNPLGWIIYFTFYRHFCAGRNAAEINAAVANLKKLGMKGMILMYAKEVDLEDVQDGKVDDAVQISQWLEGTKKTIEYSGQGEFVAIKYSGAGAPALRLLGTEPPTPPTPMLKQALDEICGMAAARNVRLLIDAEHINTQKGIDEWTVDLMRKYNKNIPGQEGKALVYNTYQMYLKSSPSLIQSHLKLAASEDWTLGVKLVRGAYLTSDPREKICDTKQETDRQFDEAVVNLVLERDALVDLVVATHNKQSIYKAKAAVEKAKRAWQKAGNSRKRRGAREVVYAQLMGMADELSFGLAAESLDAKVYKYVVWGSIQECVKYLLRRAEENQAAVERSKENVHACWQEIRCRMGLGAF